MAYAGDPATHGGTRVHLRADRRDAGIAESPMPPRALHNHEPLEPARSLRKRLFDIVVAASLAIVLSPAFALIALLIRLDSSGPVFYRCRRVGYGGRTFEMLKFRKMHRLAAGAQLTLHADERFTRTGKWLARFKADELPQLLNVLRGEMSIVGPRPESPSFTRQFPQEFDQITRVRPGIVGFSQLAFAEESQILDPNEPLVHYVSQILPQKMRLDRLYAEEWRFHVDLRVLFWSAAAVLLRRPVAVHRETGKMRLRHR